MNKRFKIMLVLAFIVIGILLYSGIAILSTQFPYSIKLALSAIALFAAVSYFVLAINIWGDL